MDAPLDDDTRDKDEANIMAAVSRGRSAVDARRPLVKTRKPNNC